jgi:hypothetical protein
MTMTRRFPLNVPSRWSRTRHIRLGVALAVDAALIASAFAAFGWIHQRTGPRAAVASVSAPMVASTPASVAVQAPPPAVQAPPLAVQGPPPRPRSPLERSPGYSPPADPESSSVLTGRRNAPAVSLELGGGARSIGALARNLLAAIQARDERAMHAQRLTFGEFEVICWPEFPQSRPITRITATDAWEFSLTSSLAGAGRTVGLYGGHELELVRVDVDRTEEFRNFRLHRGVVIVARDTVDGSEVSLHFLPSVVERHGRFKALLYHD